MSKKIFIDAGHGGRDPGTTAGTTFRDVPNMWESNINLDVSRRLGNILTKAGLIVILSRINDTALTISERWHMANTAKADYFISIHVNAGGGTGAETFIAATKEADRAFAAAVNDTYAAEMNLRNRGVKLDSTTRHGSLGVLRHTRMPAILVELAFLDSPAHNPDVNALQFKRDIMAEALAKGILNFLGNCPPTEQKPDTTDLTPIEGTPIATAAQMRAYIERVNPDAPDLAEIFIAEGIRENIRGDIAFAQSCLETGNFMFIGGTAVTLDQNNFAGIGVTSLGVRGHSFNSPTEGIRAQIHHLKAYANTEPIDGEILSPRFHLVQRGVAPYVEWLGAQENPQGRGWVMDAGYGAKILRILNNIINTEAPDAPPPQPVQNTVTFDLLGEVTEIDGYIEDEVTWVRARHLLEALGYSVGWNGEKGVVEVK